MHTYKLQMTTNTTGIPFSTFIQFYNALQTIDVIPDHYSTILYRFADQTQTKYQPGHDPVHSKSGDLYPMHVLTCPERPGLCVHVYAYSEGRERIPKSRGVHINTFKTVLTTELEERWVYTYAGCTYILTKTALATTKEHASQAMPLFNITICSAQSHCVHDLFGRYTDGKAQQLHVSSRPYCIV